MTTSRFNFCFLVFFASLFITTSCHNHLSSSNNHVALLIFGDSIFDAGNNNYLKNAVIQANFWPYGETFFKYPTGRFSDGRIIPDFIAEYMKLPLITPYLQPNNHQYTDGVNVASGGAGALVETHQGQVIDLKTQLSYYKNVENQLRKQLGDTETMKLFSRAIHLFSIGSNDYFAPFQTNSSMLQSYSSKEYITMVIGNLTTVIKEIDKNGGRKLGFINLAPLGCVPFVKALKQSDSKGGCIGQATVLAKLHNKALTKVLKELQRQLKGFIYSDFDLFTSASERTNNPSKYGLKEGKVACCGTGPYRGITSCGGKGAIKEYKLCDNPSDYLFFDGVHPTEKANNQFAKLMRNGSPNVTRP